MVNDQNRSTRIRYTAIGALAALAVVGAIAGTAALAANSPTKPHRAATVADCSTTKTPTSSGPDKAGAPEPSPNPQPFLNAVQRLVDAGTITAAQGQVVDREILAGRIDEETLTSSGFTQAQLDALQQALSSVKRGLAAATPPGSK